MLHPQVCPADSVGILSLFICKNSLGPQLLLLDSPLLQPGNSRRTESRSGVNTAEEGSLFHLRLPFRDWLHSSMPDSLFNVSTPSDSSQSSSRCSFLLHSMSRTRARCHARTTADGRTFARHRGCGSSIHRLAVRRTSHPERCPADDRSCFLSSESFPGLGIRAHRPARIQVGHSVVLCGNAHLPRSGDCFPLHRA